MANIVVRLVGNAIDLAGISIDVALSDPLSFVLVATSVVLWGVTFGLFGYLVAGALVSGIIPENFGRTPPQQGE